MTRTGSTALTSTPGRHGWRPWRNLLGGLLIVAVWLSLWAWMAVGVVRSLSAVAASANRAATPPPALAQGDVARRFRQ